MGMTARELREKAEQLQADGQLGIRRKPARHADAGKTGEVHPDDQSLNVQAFDPLGEFPYKYAFRRKKYQELEGMGP
mgnify:CR=1 FL=1